MHLELLTQEPEATPHSTPFLFVHGAWCWAEHFLPYFAQHGYVSHALDGLLGPPTKVTTLRHGSIEVDSLRLHRAESVK